MPVIRTDPLRNFKFRVQIVPEADSGLKTLAAGIGNLGFAQMSGIAVTNEVIPYREGGMNTHPHKMVGQSDFAPVSLARGVFPNAVGSGDSLSNWQLFMHTWQGGVDGGAGVTGAASPHASVDNSEYRCTVNIYVYDHPVTSSSYSYDTDPSAGSSGINLPIKLGITLFNAWPGSFSISDLNAGDNGILIQQLQLHHEGFAMEWNPEVG
jgi:phage tail-like protein